MTSKQALNLAIEILTREQKRLTASSVSYEQVRGNGYADDFNIFKSAHLRRQKYTEAIDRLTEMMSSEKQGVLI
jgi:hypothetical protein